MGGARGAGGARRGVHRGRPGHGHRAGPPVAARVGACLSLSGEFARFGRQAATALRAWRELDGGVELVLEDDRSDVGTLRSVLPEVAARCDVVLGPYSTRLGHAAVRVAAEHDLLLWNQGSAGDDIQLAAPGHVVSVLAPTSRYAEPFVRHLAADPAALRIAHGPGGFAEQAAAGAERTAALAGVSTRRVRQGELPALDLPDRWDLLCWTGRTLAPHR